jgi:membrane protein DedA with SNARE-associated domain
LEILNTLLRFFISYGYFFLFLATALENIPVIGAFLPGEVIVVAAGFFASSGDFDLTTVIVVACLGAFIGTNISYGLGYWGGRALLESLGKKFHFDGDKLKVADRYFQTHGPLTVFVGRYMSGVKAFIPALAGTHRMRLRRFEVFSSLGIVSWTIIAALLGYYFGRNWGTLVAIMKTVGWAVPALIILALLVAWFIRKRLRQAEANRRTEK